MAIKILLEKIIIDIKNAEDASTPYKANVPMSVASLTPRLASDIGNRPKTKIKAHCHINTPIGTSILAAFVANT